ncbi:hypothetical protein DFH27DRAFT_651662 [Peziza echinospora]|nr:hypothetical protein DFH27DRAFT_651662 [Peziza echinospora]
MCLLGKPIPGVAFNSKKDYQKPIDPFSLWKQHLTESAIPHGFDWALGDYIMKQHAGNSTDRVRIAKIYAKAQYLIRVCQYENNDVLLSGWLNSLTQALVNINFDVFTRPAAEDTGILEFRSLDGAQRLEEQTISSSADVARVLQTAVENIEIQSVEDTEIQNPAIVPAIYTVLAHNFFLLHPIRSNKSLIVDSMGDELALVELTNSRTTGKVILFETDVTTFWLRVAALYGYIAPNDAKSDSGIRGTRILLPLPTWVEEVEAENARIRRTVADVIKETRVQIEKKIGIFQEIPTPASITAYGNSSSGNNGNYSDSDRSGTSSAPAVVPAAAPAPMTTAATATRRAPTSRRNRAVLGLK